MSQQKFDVVSAVETAYQLYEHKHYHQCMDICISILSIDCTRADIWHLAGVVMFELEFYDRAVEYFTQAAQCQPTESYHRINLAESYRRSGNPARCITELENLLLEDSKMQNNSNLHFNLAKAYSDIEDSQSSIKHYTIAIKLDPNDLGAMFNLANAQVSLKHFGEAIELYLSALNRGYLDAGVNLANTYVQIGLFREAVQVYNVLYEHYKDDSDFLFNYANALNYANDDMQHALALYNQAIAFNPNKVEYC
ncbi:MAG: tetratricopeptide repeat protein, partial [Helicobacter japonicus]|nr:tetratricopeptide repeat protein [Helicobacter japonicus]